MLFQFTLMLLFGACNASSQSPLGLVKTMYPANMPAKDEMKMTRIEAVLQRLLHNENHEQLKNRTMAERNTVAEENNQKLANVRSLNLGKTDAEVQEHHEKCRARIKRAIAESQGRMNETEAVWEDRIQRLFHNQDYETDEMKMRRFEAILQGLLKNENHEQLKNRTMDEILTVAEENNQKWVNLKSLNFKTDEEVQEHHEECRARIAKNQGDMSFTAALWEDRLQRIFGNQDYEEKKERTMQEREEFADRNNKKTRKALVKTTVSIFVLANLPQFLALNASGAIAHAVAMGGAKGCIVGSCTGCAGEISDRLWENHSYLESITPDQKMLYAIGSEALTGAVAGAALYGTVSGLGEQEFLENMLKLVEPLKEEFGTLYKSFEGFSDKILDQCNDSGVNLITNEFVEELGEHIMQALLDMPRHH